MANLGSTFTRPPGSTTITAGAPRATGYTTGGTTYFLPANSGLTPSGGGLDPDDIVVRIWDGADWIPAPTP